MKKVSLLSDESSF